MKKFLSGIIVGVLLCGASFAATEFIAKKAEFKVFVNGTEFKGTTGEILEVDGRTYLPLRDMGNALGVAVNWNDELQQVEVGTPPANTNVAVDLDEVSNYVTGEVWNKGFWSLGSYLNDSVDMSSYISWYATSADEQFDINKIITHIVETKTVMDKYNASLKGNIQWDNLYNEYVRLYNVVQDGNYTKETFDTRYFVKVRDEFNR